MATATSDSDQKRSRTGEPDRGKQVSKEVQTQEVGYRQTVSVNRRRTGSLAESGVVMPTNIENTKPIERFRNEYGEVSGLLRERTYPDSHPASDHAWYAARIVNKVGLYHPCQSFEKDYQDAIMEWEEEKQNSKYGIPTQRKGERGLAVVLGILAGRRIVAAKIGRIANAGLVKKWFSRRRRQEKRKEIEDVEAKRCQEEEAMFVDHVGGGDDVEEDQIAAGADDDNRSFTQVENGHTVQNGEPIVKKGIMMKLYNKMLGR